MTSFDATFKSNETYIDVAANSNGEEKGMMAFDAISRLGKHDLSLLEIGPGGGSAIEFLANSLKQVLDEEQDVNLSLLEIDGITSGALSNAVNNFRALGSVSQIKGDARFLADFFDEGSLDVITTSAVLHEVYSYGGGYPALYSTLNSIARSLRVNGYYAYRDVFAVEGQSLHERTIHCYSPQSWARFIKLFVPHYLESAQHPYHGLEDGVYLRQNSKFIDYENIDCSTDVLIDAPVGVLRELQRHYITLRDHVWRSGVLGITPDLDGIGSNDWIDKREGHKRVRFTITDQGSLSSTQQYLLSVISEKYHDKLVVDGDTFDEITDSVLSNFLHLVEHEDADSKKVWDAWLSREGSETYTYMTTGQFVGSVVLRSIENSEDRDSILLPEKATDVKTVPRFYYNRFLRKRLANPLFDGKQQVLFKKIPLKDTDAIYRGLEIIQLHCPKNMLSNIYSTINSRI